LADSAAIAQERSIGASLKLISGAHARKQGRTSSFEIELIPDPTRKIHAIDGTNRYNLDKLGALLLAALNAGPAAQNEPPNASPVWTKVAG
jgi:hypothetical protein